MKRTINTLAMCCLVLATLFSVTSCSSPFAKDKGDSNSVTLTEQQLQQKIEKAKAEALKKKAEQDSLAALNDTTPEPVMYIALGGKVRKDQGAIDAIQGLRGNLELNQQQLDTSSVAIQLLLDESYSSEKIASITGFYTDGLSAVMYEDEIFYTDPQGNFGFLGKYDEKSQQLITRDGAVYWVQGRTYHSKGQKDYQKIQKNNKKLVPPEQRLQQALQGATANNQQPPTKAATPPPVNQSTQAATPPPNNQQRTKAAVPPAEKLVLMYDKN